MDNKHKHGKWKVCNTVVQPDKSVNIYFECTTEPYCQSLRKQTYRPVGRGNIIEIPRRVI